MAAPNRPAKGMRRIRAGDGRRVGYRAGSHSLLTGDTDALRSGGGSHSDRSMRFAGALLMETSGQIVAPARKAAAALATPTSRCGIRGWLLRYAALEPLLCLFDIARAIEAEPIVPTELRSAHAEAPSPAACRPPDGCAMCEVEVDPNRRDRNDALCLGGRCGRPINPLVLHGQVHGGIAQVSARR